ncbi:SGNH/GDSL hydrolase family protein [Hymenobacter psoromatis]|uniref:SGNH/GDSL hydrolase family protein n=1 Tax=Hymenobacter psoromatis TaxID=1484116 RepID=UPI001CBE7312|nr:SGNH/GDSL hydrolase family protein [Hymenobacter psoromatis]
MTSLFSLQKATRPALTLLGLGLGLAGCQTNIDAPSASPGTLDFTSYVAVGNSLTSGYTDGGLYNSAQATSYPALLAQQFGKTGKGPATFVQPAFSAGKADGSGYIKLLAANGALGPVVPSLANQFLGEQVAYTGQALLSGQPQLEAYSGAQPDNLGVPGISVLSSYAPLTGGLAPYGLLNQFYERLLTPAEKPTKDYVTYIGQKTPTFFTCWMGNNDVLTYATNGGVASPADPFSDLTDTLRFGIGYRAILTTMTKNGTVKGAVANIPGVTGVPYFTTVTVAAVNASIKGNAALPNAATAGLYITTAKGVRAATATDLLTLTAQGAIGQPSTTPGNPFPVGVGYSATQSNPLPSKYVLDPDEVTALTARTTQLNAIIAKTARRFNVPVVDMNAYFASVIASGAVSNAVSNNATFVTGNVFGLDGVHPTPRGYALIANEWLRVINNYYGSTIPGVNANDYRGVLLP